MKKTLLLTLFTGIALLSKAQTYYGMTSGGGANSNGAIISFNTVTGKESLVWSFGSGKDGAAPEGTLAYDTSNGLFYGLTARGGSNSVGAIISFNPVTNKDSVLWSFAGYPSDGSYPYGDLVYDANNGLFYGMTYAGGSNNIGFYGGGTIFTFNPVTNKDSVVWNFGGYPIDGAFPYRDLIYDANNSLFYGMTGGGGNVYNYTYNGAGAIISFNPATNKDSVVWNFGTGTDGENPGGNLIYDAANKLFYGMTGTGGDKDTSSGEYGYGTIISFNPTGNYESLVWNFAGPASDGSAPGGSLVYDTAKATFYAMTYYGGADSLGAIINFNPANSESLVWSFGKGTDAAEPTGDLVYDANNGLFYGMTLEGGTNGTNPKDGAIISFDPNSNSESVLWDFGGGTDGLRPYGNLVIYPPSVGAGIEQLSVNNKQLSVYPNPTSGQFTIRSNSNQNGYTVEVYNLMGEKVYQSVLGNYQPTINLSSQPDGMYFVYLKSGEDVKVGKLMLTK